MGEAFYAFLVEVFTNKHNMHGPTDAIVSSGLSNLGMFVACLSLTCTLLWFTLHSVLIKRTVMVYLFAAFIGLGGVSQFGHVVIFPLWLQLSVDLLATTVSLYTAFLMWKQRHFILSVVYQFKYVIGLLKSLDALDETDK